MFGVVLLRLIPPEFCRLLVAYPVIEYALNMPDWPGFSNQV